MEAAVIQNVGILPQHYMMSQPRRTWLKGGHSLLHGKYLNIHLKNPEKTSKSHQPG
jgi:hypothetical protein